jgi:hypothetical protein
MNAAIEQLTARYAEAIRTLPTDENYRDERVRLAKWYADEVESLERRERSSVDMFSEDEPPLVKPEGRSERVKGVPAGMRI